MHKLKSKPKVSVCIVAYQHANVIAQALDGVLMQQLDHPIEILVHDDASTDSTAEIISSYADRHPPGLIIPTLQKRNQYSKGRKPYTVLFEKARGEYLALCDGDDRWTDPTKLQQQIDLLEANPDLAGSYHQTAVQEGGRSTGKIMGLHPDLSELKIEDTLSLFAPFHISSFVLRNYHLHFPRWFGRMASSDMALFAMVAEYGNFKGIPKRMSIYAKLPSGVSSKIDQERKVHRERVKLMHALDKYFNGRYSKHIAGVIAEHERQIRWQGGRPDGKVKGFVKSLLGT